MSDVYRMSHRGQYTYTNCNLRVLSTEGKPNAMKSILNFFSFTNEDIRDCITHSHEFHAAIATYQCLNDAL